MEHFTPKLQAGEVCTNVRNFVKEHDGEIWKLFKPLVPFIVGLYFFDAVVSSLFFSNSDTGFYLGSVAASYFYICLFISWHRFVIKGPDGCVPMNPLDPQENELGYIAAGVVIWIFISVIMSATVTVVGNMGFMNSILAGVPLIAAVFLASVYAAYRFWFYFPATAVDAPVTPLEAFKKSGGYLWKLIYATFLASLKVVALMVLYFVVLWIIGLAVYFMTDITMNGFISKFLFALPIHLYFQPVLAVLGITAVSNYYLYALQDSNEDAGEAVADETVTDSETSSDE